MHAAPQAREWCVGIAKIAGGAAGDSAVECLDGAPGARLEHVGPEEHAPKPAVREAIGVDVHGPSLGAPSSLSPLPSSLR